MRDLLGYAVAALIGLLTATLQPWSPQWWAGVSLASAIALITSLHLLWSTIPDRFKTKEPVSQGQRLTIVFFVALVVAIAGFEVRGWMDRLIPPPPSPVALLPPKPVPVPAPPTPPWVSEDEIAQQKKLGRTLLIYSPERLFDISIAGQDTVVFDKKWMKIDYPVAGIPILQTLDKKEYYVEQINMGMRFSMKGAIVEQLLAYFDPKKFGEQLLALQKGQRLTAICQFEGFELGQADPNGGGRSLTLFGYNCEIL